MKKKWKKQNKNFKSNRLRLMDFLQYTIYDIYVILNLMRHTRKVFLFFYKTEMYIILWDLGIGLKIFGFSCHIVYMFLTRLKELYFCHFFFCLFFSTSSTTQWGWIVFLTIYTKKLSIDVHCLHFIFLKNIYPN